MRIRWILCAAVIVLALAFAGCGGSAGDDPASAAKAAFEKTLSMDIDGLLAMSCNKMKEEIESSREEIKLMQEMMKGLGVDLKDIKYDLSGLVWDVLEENETAAKVHMHGQMTMSAPGLGEETQDQDEEIALVKEDGAWKICSEMQ